MYTRFVTYMQKKRNFFQLEKLSLKLKIYLQNNCTNSVTSSSVFDPQFLPLPDSSSLPCL